MSELQPFAQETLRGLIRTWTDFERRLAKVPVLRRLDTGTFSVQDYQRLLFNLRAQVVEGARWITRAASSFDRHHADVRSIIISHAKDEHRDYEILEQDYVRAGGELEAIQAGERNIGSEALAAFLMHQATQPNPVDMLGAMFIIEGLGEKMASSWAARICELTGLPENATTFLGYHGVNDESHMERFYTMLDRVATTPERVAAIGKTARVVARLYALQLEELDNV
ncbi:MAG: iron-containing redox enzyme family protein [Myxococcota bacterium]|nr:iron-containing redox enzyme family protein [Myxococcota bacterium]